MNIRSLIVSEGNTCTYRWYPENTISYCLVNDKPGLERCVYCKNEKCKPVISLFELRQFKLFYKDKKFKVFYCHCCDAVFHYAICNL